MKKTIFLSALVAFIVSGMTMSGFYYFNKDKPIENKVTIEKLDGQASSVLYTKDENGEVQALNFEKVAAETMPAVVSVHSKIENQMAKRQEQFMNPFKRFFDFEDSPFFHQLPEHNIGTGSGVIINSQGYIVTNNHVIDGAESVNVILNDNREYEATIVGTDPSTDIALLKIEGAEDLTVLPLVNSDNVRVGQWVLAVGNPFNLTSTVTAGIISAKARNINILDNKYAVESFIQTDAAINKGNSGGALVDLQGGLVGINSAIFSPSGTNSGYGFAIPSNLVNKVIEDILEYGTVQRGFLGVSIADVNSELAKKENLNVNTGVYVASVQEGGAAQKAGVKSGDVIIKIDDREVRSSPNLQELIARKRPGDNVKITVLRKGKEVDLDAVLFNQSGTTSAVELASADVAGSLGIDLRNLTAKEAKALRVEGGALIEKINDGTIARETSIREGFVILEVDDLPVTTVEDVNKIIGSKKGNYIEIKGVYKDAPGVYYYGVGINN